MVRWLPCLCLLLLSACSVNLLGDPPPPSHFYRLRGVHYRQPEVHRLPSATMLQMDRIQVADYLQSSSLLQRVGGHEYLLLELQQWLEPLDKNLQTVLQQNLSQLLDPVRFQRAGDPVWQPPDMSLHLFVAQFNATASGVEVRLHWILEQGGGEGSRQTKRGIFQKQLPCPPQPTAWVQTLDHALAQFCLQIAREVAFWTEAER